MRIPKSMLSTRDQGDQEYTKRKATKPRRRTKSKRNSQCAPDAGMPTPMIDVQQSAGSVASATNEVILKRCVRARYIESRNQ